MSRIRILIGGMPRMLRDILEDAIGAQPDMELVASSEAGDLPTAVERHQPNVIIVATEGVSLDLARVQLRRALPRLGVLVVTSAGRHARLVELRQISVNDVSLKSLVETIRAEFGQSNEG